MTNWEGNEQHGYYYSQLIPDSPVRVAILLQVENYESRSAFMGLLNSDRQRGWVGQLLLDYENRDDPFNIDRPFPDSQDELICLLEVTATSSDVCKQKLLETTQRFLTGCLQIVTG